MTRDSAGAHPPYRIANRILGIPCPEADMNYQTKALQHLRFVNPPPDGISVGRTADERRLRIAEAAYFKALRRGFTPGYESQDWLEAEREIDARRYHERAEPTEGTYP